jgi:hypothetical protein
MNHANGSRYHGDTEMRYRLADTDTSVVSTAPHALTMSNWNTCSSSSSSSSSSGSSGSGGEMEIGLHSLASYTPLVAALGVGRV